MVVQAILIRHAEKESAACNAPLARSGVEKTAQLGAFLVTLGLKPNLVLSSRLTHAEQTADGLVQAFPPPRPNVQKVAALTPKDQTESPRASRRWWPRRWGRRSCKLTRRRRSRREIALKDQTEIAFSIESMIEEARRAGHKLSDETTIIFVGHEPELTQLATMMTTTRFAPLERLEALCIQSDTLNDLRLGRGRLRWRWLFPGPVAATSQDELGPKLTNKMTVAALLAGFNFTALLELVKEPEKLQIAALPAWSEILSAAIPDKSIFPLLTFAAIIFLTSSLVLFVIAIYIYDRLSMPPTFLESLPIVQLLAKNSKSMQDRIKRFGFVYAAMIHAWQWVFTPAVTCTVLGFLSILARASFTYAESVLCVLVVGLLYYQVGAPHYSVD